MKSTLFCFLYLVASSIGILISKKIIDDGFVFPIFVHFISQVLTTLLSLSYLYFNQIDKNAPICITIGVTSALTHILGHYSYVYLTMAFIQMLKALTPIMVVIALWISNTEIPNTGTLTSITGLSFGGVLVSYGEINFNMIGVMYMLTSSLADGIRLVLTQNIVNGYSPFAILAAYSKWSAISTFPFMLLEVTDILKNDNVTNGILWTLLNGILSCIISFSTIKIIHMEGSTTLRVITTIRNILLVAGSNIIHTAKISSLTFIGYITLIFFLSMYIRSNAKRANTLPI